MKNQNAAFDPQWAWESYVPSDERPWTLKWVGHLYRRAAFGASWEQLRQAMEEGPARTVERLLNPSGNTDEFETSFDEYESAAANSDSTEGLRAWWLRRMIQTPDPLKEKMTLFWHNHFAIDCGKVKSGVLALQRLRLNREDALGNYAHLLQAIVHHPTTFLALNAEKNRKVLPNDNFAKKVLENYCLGPDMVSEQDIHETARAFTGWFLIRNECRFLDREHDHTNKRILGEEGDFDSQDVINIILRRPDAAQFIVRKLYRFFISEVEEPAHSFLEPLVRLFTADFNIKKVITVILKSNLFFSETAYRKRVKSPIEYALEIVRGFEANVSTTHLGNDLKALGQDLFHPPTVKGWLGGRHWINSAALIGRCNLAHALISNSAPYEKQLAFDTVFEKYKCKSDEESCQFILNLFLQDDLDETVRKQLYRSTADKKPSSWLQRFTIDVLTCPEFQIG